MSVQRTEPRPVSTQTFVVYADSNGKPLPPRKIKVFDAVHAAKEAPDKAVVFCFCEASIFNFGPTVSPQPVVRAQSPLYFIDGETQDGDTALVQCRDGSLSVFNSKLNAIVSTS